MLETSNLTLFSKQIRPLSVTESITVQEFFKARTALKAEFGQGYLPTYLSTINIDLIEELSERYNDPIFRSPTRKTRKILDLYFNHLRKLSSLLYCSADMVSEKHLKIDPYIYSKEKANLRPRPGENENDALLRKMKDYADRAIKIGDELVKIISENYPEEDKK